MRVSTLVLRQYRSFVECGPISLAQINVFIGPNNSGKTSVLRALHAMQLGLDDYRADVRLGAPNTAQIEIGLSDVRGHGWPTTPTAYLTALVSRSHGVDAQLGFNLPTGSIHVNALGAQDPNHFVVPFLAKRKTFGYLDNVNLAAAFTVDQSLKHLAAKLTRVANPQHPAYAQYERTSREILGFVVVPVPTANGQGPAIYLADGKSIPLSQLGEGVPHIVGLLADLALSEGKLFLIEEPETELHPSALKALLDLFIESSSKNQFAVTTHSNIVARNLGAANNAKLFLVETKPGTMPPESSITEVARTPEARIAVLQSLGYSFSDFDLWDGWLILEEASAERIIRDYLIPWFVPRLSRVRTVSANGNSKVEPTFDDFHRMVAFTHLEEAYRNAAWVLVDGDPGGQEIVTRLRQRFGTWDPTRFGYFNEPQFEAYYPAAFDAERSAVLGLIDKGAKRAAKKKLLDKVREWLDADEARGRSALEISAAPVIGQLQSIERDLISMGRMLPPSASASRVSTA